MSAPAGSASPSSDQLASFLSIAEDVHDLARRRSLILPIAFLHARAGDLAGALKVRSKVPLTEEEERNYDRYLREVCISRLHLLGRHDAAICRARAISEERAVSARVEAAECLIALERSAEAVEYLRGARFENGRVEVGTGSQRIASSRMWIAVRLLFALLDAGLAAEGSQFLSKLAPVYRDFGQGTGQEEADPSDKPQRLSTLGLAYAVAGQDRESRALFAQAETLTAGIADDPLRGICWASMACDLRCAGMASESRAALDKSLAILAGLAPAEARGAVTCIRRELGLSGRAKEMIALIWGPDDTQASITHTVKAKLLFEELMSQGASAAAAELVDAASAYPCEIHKLALPGSELLWPAWISGARCALAAQARDVEQVNSRFREVLDFAKRSGAYELHILAELITQLELAVPTFDDARLLAEVWSRVAANLTLNWSAESGWSSDRLAVFITLLEENDRGKRRMSSD